MTDREKAVLQRISNLTVTDLINYCRQESIELEELHKIFPIHEFEEAKKIKVKIDLAINRKHAPLSIGYRILLILFPMGDILGNDDEARSMLKGFQVDGFERKTRQFYFYSGIGFLFYLLVVLAFIFL